jgi:hypothetical protein
MSMKSDIDEALSWLGSIEPPAGLEQRVQARLQISQRRWFVSRTRTVSLCALAASIAVSAVVVNPAWRSAAFHHDAKSLQAPRVATPSAGFGTASAVHIPMEPVPVQPTPVNQGRGRSRSGRAVLTNGGAAPLPRGVTAPEGAAASTAESTH